MKQQFIFKAATCIILRKGSSIARYLFTPPKLISLGAPWLQRLYCCWGSVLFPTPS